MDGENGNGSPMFGVMTKLHEAVVVQNELLRQNNKVMSELQESLDSVYNLLNGEGKDDGLLEQVNDLLSDFELIRKIFHYLRQDAEAGRKINGTNVVIAAQQALDDQEGEEGK